MALVRDVLDGLERLAPARFGLGFDRIGLQVGDPEANVRRCAVSLDRSHGAIQFALDLGAEMLVSHHPLIFQPVSSVTSGSYEGKAILKLARAGICFAAAHTNWDAARGGISDALADKLGMSDLSSFGMASDSREQPIDRVGVLAEAINLARFTQFVDQRLGCRSWTWGDSKSVIHRVAVAGGAADSDWRAALEAGADVFLVGEVKQHVAVEATESGISMIASGHYATEQPGIVALRDRLAAEVSGVEFVLFTPSPGMHGRPL